MCILNSIMLSKSIKKKEEGLWRESSALLPGSGRLQAPLSQPLKQ